MPSNYLILCHPFLLLLSIFPSIRVFPKESALPIRWPKDWSFSISPPNEYSGLISFRMDWFDPAIQGTLKSLLQHHSSKASILWRSAFFMVQLFAVPWTAACQVSLAFTISRRLLKLISIESVMPSNYLILCHPFLLLPSIFPTIGVFSNELALCIRWPKYWSFSFSISPCSEYSVLISFRTDWLISL